MVAAITKRAQVPFSAWLPAAMAAPTPVSSLVHSSTLVTAGVYLLYRAYDGLLLGRDVFEGLGYIRLVTLTIAGGAALVEVDFKKVVALSTLRQLRIMIFSLSIGLPIVAFFHLVSHAMFKALLFLCVGVVIHENKSFQDVRSLGHGWSRYPVSMSCLVVAMFSLCGVPFISGFYSKDCIVESGLLSGQSSGFFLILIAGLVFTFYYSLRMANNALCGIRKGAIRVVKSQEQVVVKVSYSRLLGGALIIGYLLVEIIEGFIVSMEPGLKDKFMVMIMGVLSYFMYYIVLISEGGVKERVIVFFLRSIGHIKHLSGGLCRILGLGLRDLCVRVMDKGWLEKVGPQGAGEIIGGQFGRYSQRVQGGQYFQVILMCLGVGYRFLLLLIGT